mmetsp:Transcript_5952/g.17208  ORF Transcript_5952/g.17208 Transcript_5952/m.17208 type:complete len:295 (+) Transcript_5952:429-1313(+)
MQSIIVPVLTLARINCILCYGRNWPTRKIRHQSRTPRWERAVSVTIGADGLALLVYGFQHWVELLHLPCPLYEICEFTATQCTHAQETKATANNNKRESKYKEKRSSAHKNKDKCSPLHDAVNVAQRDHDAQPALDPLVHPLQLGPRLLPLLLVARLLERLHERLDGRGDRDGMTDAHGYDDLVGLELHVLDIREGLGEYGHEGGDVEAARAFLEAGGEYAESGLPEGDGIVDGVLERAEVDHPLQVQDGDLIQRWQDVLLHQPRHKMGRVVDGRIDHEERRVLDAQVVLLQQY